MDTRDYKAEAQQLREEAGRYFAEHRREGDTERGQEALGKANAAITRAGALEAEGREKTSRGRDHGDEAQQVEGGKRRWFEPGSVAGDLQTQLSEASQGGLLAQCMAYAARSGLDKQHRSFEGAKLVGKAVSAPLRAAREYAKKEHGQTTAGKPPSLGPADRETGEKPARRNDPDRTAQDRSRQSDQRTHTKRQPERER